MVSELKLGDISVDVVFKDIKNVHLSVYPPTGRVRISAPKRMSVETIRLFAISKIGWIKSQQTTLLNQERETPREFLDRESHYLWGKRYLLRIEQGARPSFVDIAHNTIVLGAPDGAEKTKKLEILEGFYRKELKVASRPLIDQWEKKLGVKVEKFFVQKMKTKWGSCNSRDRRIRVNLELAKKPVECLEYILVHEMIHFFAHDHGDEFVRLMDKHIPNWAFLRKKLNEAPLSHSDWTY